MSLTTNTKLSILGAIFILASVALQPILYRTTLAQVAPAVETTPPTEPPTSTFTPTPTDTPTETPTPTVTETPTTPTVTPVTITATPTNTPPEGPPPPPPPAIPEPVTVVLFGTGLAALSAAVAARRRKGE